MGQRWDLLHSSALLLLSEAENYSWNPYNEVKGVVFNHRGQYLDEPWCNKSHHYLIWADNICFVISSSEMVNLINKKIVYHFLLNLKNAVTLKTGLLVRQVIGNVTVR